VTVVTVTPLRSRGTAMEAVDQDGIAESDQYYSDGSNKSDDDSDQYYSDDMDESDNAAGAALAEAAEKTAEECVDDYIAARAEAAASIKAASDSGECDDYNDTVAQVARPSSRKATRQLAATVRAHEEESIFLDTEACQAAAVFRCKCYISCSLRAQMTPEKNQGYRRGTLAVPLARGARLLSVARSIEATKTSNVHYFSRDKPPQSSRGQASPKVPGPSRHKWMGRVL